MCIQEEDNAEEEWFIPPSTWVPPEGREQMLETYIRAVRTNTHQQMDITVQPTSYASRERQGMGRVGVGKVGYSHLHK